MTRTAFKTGGIPRRKSIAMNIGYNRAQDPSQYGAIILAAGLSSRMKDFKPLLPVDGRPAITGLVETVRTAGIRDIIVVTGYQREKLQEIIRKQELLEAVNEAYERGMFSSIQTGLKKAKEAFPDKKGVFLIPVDCPLITVRALREVMTAFDGIAKGVTKADSAEAVSSIGSMPQDAAGLFCVPTFEGKKGHPLLIPSGRMEEIIDYDGSGGLKAITDRHWDSMLRVPVPDEEILLDMDTPEGYEAIRYFVARGFKREKLSVLSSRKRIVLVRHGQTKQHAEPVFIGQYDVPLSGEGRAQAETLGEEIADLIAPDVEASASWIEGISLGKEPLPPIERVYSSDLSRAKETAEIIADRINARYDRKSGAQAGGFDNDTFSSDAQAGGMELASLMQGMLPAADFTVHVDVQPLQGLREIDLGPWDGRPIREIKEEEPELYERRGRDLFAFKTGNRSENFYDMQYRAKAALREILANDDARNIVIVAHSGVIRALENALKGLQVEDEWEPLPKGAYRAWEGRMP